MQKPREGLGGQVRAIDKYGGPAQYTVSLLALPLIPRLTRRRLAADDEFVLQSVTVFKKVKEEFTHKCRENK